MQRLSTTTAKPVWLVLCLSLICSCALAQQKIERAQKIYLTIVSIKSPRAERSIPLVVHCAKKDFGLRISGNLKRPPRDLTATRIAFGISIKPFIKSKTQKL